MFTLMSIEKTKYLKLIFLDDSLVDVLLDLVKNGQHGDVCLASSRRRTDQQVLVCFVCRLEHHRLDTV